MLNIETTAENGKVLLALEGRLDTLSSPELEQQLNALLPGCEVLTLDLKKLDYLSSAGLRVLLSAQKRMNGRGSMIVKNVGEVVMDIFEVTGFNEILTIE